MLLIEALVMVAQTYPKEAGWMIQGPHGCILKQAEDKDLAGVVPREYMAYGAQEHYLKSDTELEVVLAALAEHDAYAFRDEHWKIVIRLRGEIVSNAMDELASRTPCTQEHQWNDGRPVRMCTQCGFFEVVN